MSENLELTKFERSTIITDKLRDMILRGKSRPECLAFIAGESKRLGYENKESQCSNIYQRVKHELKQELEENKEYMLAEITSKMCYLYKKSLENDDYKEARECLKEIAKLAGVSNGPSVEISRPEENITITFT